MTTWGLILETTVGFGERKHTEAYVVAHVEGPREAALAELERRARAYSPEHPRSPQRRRLFRSGDGFLLVIDGAWQSHATRFAVAELMDDTDRPAPAEAGGGTAPAPPQPATPTHATSAVDSDEDGIPVKPAWWGRTDLA
ncbi:hypothetical protein ACFWFZ_25885 [Streptomyces sp. NPDC060232]|uniref:hypothetical protein n=1 Tax=Streptomyces sp. NPDC060232 TaxID=3347079 RepID=UPI003669C3F7